MRKIKDIVCDFKYAEKIWNLSLRKKPIFTYSVINGKCRGINHAYSKIGGLNHDNSVCNIPTYTVAELGEILFSQVPSIKTYRCERSNDFYIEQGSMYFSDAKEANARAKLLIMVLENKNEIQAK